MVKVHRHQLRLVMRPNMVVLEEATVTLEPTHTQAAVQFMVDLAVVLVELQTPQT